MNPSWVSVGREDDSWTAAATRPPLAARHPHNLTGRATVLADQTARQGFLEESYHLPKGMPLLLHPLAYFANTFSSPPK